MPVNVPPAVATYLAAEKAKDVDLLAGCFAPDATVRDEGHAHVGLAAIQSWKRNADAKYHYTMDPLSASSPAPGRSTVRARLTGDFPGSPVELNFHFTLSGDKIAALEVQP